MIAATACVVGATAAMFLATKKSSRPKGSSAPAGKDGPRRYLIGGNWKCNGTMESNADRIKAFNEAGPIPENVDVVLCVPYVHIPMVLEGLRADIEIGAQDCGVNKSQGAYTGEICADQLKDIGCTWVIIGHSERREGFGMQGEPEKLCADKCKVALDAGVKVMFAIGEKKEEREAGTTMQVCAKQLEPLAKVLTPAEWENVAIAYEPVWAVSSSRWDGWSRLFDSHKITFFRSFSTTRLVRVSRLPPKWPKKRTPRSASGLRNTFLRTWRRLRVSSTVAP